MYLTSSHYLRRKSLDLVESLLRLSEVGQYEQVKQLFGFPIKHCPDMLVLALLQISTSWHTLRHELISTLMPIFLGNHPNSAIILHYAWHGQVGIRSCFLSELFKYVVYTIQILVTQVQLDKAVTWAMTSGVIRLRFLHRYT